MVFVCADWPEEALVPVNARFLVISRFGLCGMLPVSGRV